MDHFSNFREASRLCIIECADSLHSQSMELDVVVTRLESVIITSRVCHYEQFDFVQECISLLECVVADISAILTPAPRLLSGSGRPEIGIDMSAVENLLELNFTGVTIAKMVGVSIRTLRRRLNKYNISIRETYSQFTADELSNSIRNLLIEFPNTGYKRMRGFLLQQGIKVTELRVRETMREVDPEGVYQRLASNRAVVRRVYFVTYSNEMWHIDTHLKLIRWKICVRGGVDGKSRTCVYLDAGSDNRAVSNLQSFMQGVERYGIPFRCRSDKGKENVLVAQFMLLNRGLGRASHICGRSVHNQRIERFWRDLQYGCLGFYKTLFLQMEEDGILNVENPAHIYALHKIFLPRLNRHLNLFMEGWNLHPLSTENNWSPQQLMIAHLPPAFFDCALPQINVPIELPINVDEDLASFENEDTLTQPSADTFLISAEQQFALDQINPLEESSSYGVNLYRRCLQNLHSC